MWSYLLKSTFSELEVKIIALNEITNIKKLEGHRRGVRRATWHPSGTILVRVTYCPISHIFIPTTLQTTCGSDGDIIVWDVSLGEEPKRLETIEGIISSVGSEYVLQKEADVTGQPLSDTIRSADYMHDCSAVWHPSGKYFVIASRTHGNPPLVFLSMRNFTDVPLCCHRTSCNLKRTLEKVFYLF